MAKLNVPRTPIHTHEGAVAQHISPAAQLRRSVMACLLWEQEFYEDGQEIAGRIAAFIPQVEAQKVADMAIEARSKMHLRHVPLLIVREMARYASHKGLVADTLDSVIQRADELTEFLAIYWKDGRQPLAKQVKKGLARAFGKFDEYQLAKYNRDGQVKLRDVLFLCHAKPQDAAQDALWKRLIDGELAVPDTWEVALSAQDGVSKKDKWIRLLQEKRLGAMALLRNLRNMAQAGVEEALILTALAEMNPARVLPFRFIAAARYAPQWEPELEAAMLKCLAVQPKFPGKTVLLIDVSGSMAWELAGRSEMTRMDAACGLAILLREVCEAVEVFTFSEQVALVPPRHGFALRDAIVQSQYHRGTYLGQAVMILDQRPETTYDRLIVLTDEQAHDAVRVPHRGRNYLINVASARNGVGYGGWTHIDGWSEAIVTYLQELEGGEADA